LCQNGVNGFLCTKDDDDAIAKALAQILSDKKLRAAFGKKSLEIAKTHDLQHTLDRFEEIYESVIAAKTPVLR
jgi:glycosyltransferase involved in cell wall biosynthesis